MGLTWKTCREREKGKGRRGERTPRDGKISFTRGKERERGRLSSSCLFSQRKPFSSSGYARREEREDVAGERKRQREREKREREERKTRGGAFPPASPRDGISVARERAMRRKRNKENKEKFSLWFPHDGSNFRRQETRGAKRKRSKREGEENGKEKRRISRHENNLCRKKR